MKIQFVMMKPLVACLLLAISTYTLGFNSMNSTDVPFCLNIAFVIHHPIRGTDLMRGLMVADAFNRQNSCVQATVMTSNEAHIAEKLFSNFSASLCACVFVKGFDAHSRVIEYCMKMGAAIFIDVLDSHRVLSSIIGRVTNHTNLTPHGMFNYSFLVQSLQFTEKLRTVGVHAYDYPHHHSNLKHWGLNNVTTSRDIVVGHLVGSSRHLFDFTKVILPSICDAGATFAVVNQNIGNFANGGSTIRSSLVNSTKWLYNCSKGSRGEFLSTKSVHTTKVLIPGDKFQQAAYYLDTALQGIDVGLAWVNSKTLRLDEYAPEMLRPPTRLLHWLSRGVPTIYYPTHSYLEVAKSGSYERGLSFNLSAKTAQNLRDIVTKLRDPQLRQQLHDQGLATAKDYTVDRMTSRLVNIIVEHTIRCACSYPSNCQHHPTGRKVDCKALRAFRAITLLT